MPALALNLVGTVVNASEKGLLVKAPRMVPIGTRLVDVRNQPIGKVVDVIGPVAAPFLVVNPGKGAKTQRLLSREVYAP